MAPAGPAKRASPAKKPRRRRQADAAPTAPPCQLTTRLAHCRFERCQRVRAEKTDVLRTLGESRPRPSLMRWTDIPRTAPGASGLAGGGRDHTEWGHWAPL